MQQRAHVVVRGRVQGVGYRAWAESEALSHGLKGWVRNRRDGTVEAVIAGEAETVGAMLHAMRGGPPAAAVEALSVDEWTGPIGRSFEMLPTV